eukprot:Rhum_TRINITY_DN11921_c0_g1::Rhum_TRINITY_DN11921_c0_g1_i1::g.48089::m.48089
MGVVEGGGGTGGRRAAAASTADPCLEKNNDVFPLFLCCFHASLLMTEGGYGGEDRPCSSKKFTTTFASSLAFALCCSDTESTELQNDTTCWRSTRCFAPFAFSFSVIIACVASPLSDHALKPSSQCSPLTHSAARRPARTCVSSASSMAEDSSSSCVSRTPKHGSLPWYGAASCRTSDARSSGDAELAALRVASHTAERHGRSAAEKALSRLTTESVSGAWPCSKHAPKEVDATSVSRSLIGCTALSRSSNRTQHSGPRGAATTALATPEKMLGSEMSVSATWFSHLPRPSMEASGVAGLHSPSRIVPCR